MKLVSVFFLFLISLCNGQTFVCHYYEQQSKLLQIYCDDRQRENCASGVPTLSQSDVLNLKIEGCDQIFIGATTQKYPNIKRLDLSDSNHQFLNWTDRVFEDLIAFDGSGNELTAIPSSILSQFPKLQTLRLDDNYIEKINTGDFIGQELSYLFLSNNRLKSIDDNAFNHLSKLTEINLSRNYLSTYPAALSGKSNVRIVDLSENPQLTKIDCAFITAAMHTTNVSLTWEYVTEFDGSCSKVGFVVKHGSFDQINNDDDHSELVCDNSNHKNCFKNIRSFVAGPGLFANVSDMVKLLGPSAEKIDLTGNPIHDYKAKMFEKFSNLRELNLGGTGLEWLSLRLLNQQPNLNRLDISKNNLNGVIYPSQLQNLTQLTYFDASGNHIENVDEVVRNLSASVQHLDLSGSRIRNASVLNDFERLPALTHLGLSDTHLPLTDQDPFKNLQHLTSLDISNNDLSAVDFSKLQSLNRLKEIRAANTQTEHIPEIIQQLGPFVGKLDLSGNPGAKFDVKTLAQLQNSKNLNLDNINIDHFDISADELSEIDVEHLPRSLKRINLHGNNLEQIKNLDRKHFPALKELDVSDTDLDCKEVDKLRLEFKDANVIGAECFSIVLKIFLAILALLAIAIIILLCSLWIFPKMCEEKSK